MNWSPTCFLLKDQPQQCNCRHANDSFISAKPQSLFTVSRASSLSLNVKSINRSIFLSHAVLLPRPTQSTNVSSRWWPKSRTTACLLRALLLDSPTPGSFAVSSGCGRSCRMSLRCTRRVRYHILDTPLGSNRIKAESDISYILDT